MKKIRIGRNPDNDIMINHPAVSGYHSEINIGDDSEIVFVDYSTNGTNVNGFLVRKTSCQVQRGNKIIFPGGNMLNWDLIPMLSPSNYIDLGNKAPYVYNQININDTFPPTNTVENKKHVNMGFVEAINHVYSHYFDFSSRARRSEYWYFYLFNILVSLLFLGVILVLGFDGVYNLIMYGRGRTLGTTLIPMVLYGLFTVVNIVPSWALMVRRLHDIGKSGLWLLLLFVPFVNGIFSIVLLVFCCIDSQPYENDYGSNPKENNV